MGVSWKEGGFRKVFCWLRNSWLPVLGPCSTGIWGDTEEKLAAFLAQKLKIMNGKHDANRQWCAGKCLKTGSLKRCI